MGAARRRLRAEVIYMSKEEIQKLEIPDSPGVYFFLSADKGILYIGKATSLRSRIRSYFTDDIREKRSEIIENMVIEAKSVEWTETDSVLEAMIMEVNLIRTHKPRYNTRSKDDKSYNHLIITNEDFPRVLIVRGKDITEKFEEKEIKYIFGPFPSGSLFKEALKIVRKIFRFYDTRRPLDEIKSKMGRGKIDFNRQIGLYPDEENKEVYNRTIRHIKLFFEGKKKQLMKELERDMMRAAKEERFEEAGRIKKQLFALQHIQDIALIKKDTKLYRDDRQMRIEAYDVAHLEGEEMVGVMTVIEHGEIQKGEYRKFKINSFDKANDTGALTEMIDRRLGHDEWPLPQLIVMDGGKAQVNAAEKILKTYGIMIPVVGVVKNDRHMPERIIGPRESIKDREDEILLANSEAHRFAIQYHREKRSKRMRE